MPGFNIDSFKSNFQDGARAYLFYVFINNPVSGTGTDRTAYMVRSSSLPESTITPIEVPYQGMSYKLGGTHEYADWTVTFIVDMFAQIHKDFKRWQRMIHDPQTNIHGLPAMYMQDQEVWHLNQLGVPINRIKLVGAWPTSVGEVALSHDSKEISTFDVTFSYMYHR